MTQPQQLGFGFDEMLEEERTSYLPSTMEEAIPFYRKLIERHHEAMLAGDVETTMAIRAEAHDLAVKLSTEELCLESQVDPTRRLAFWSEKHLRPSELFHCGARLGTSS